MEAFLRALFPRVLPEDKTFEVHPFQGKADLLSNLEPRLRSYAKWLPEDWRVMVIVDRDDDDCKALKKQLELASSRAGLKTRSTGRGQPWKVANRVAIEELEAWFFGEWDAVREAFPRVPAGIPGKQGFRNPDAIAGGTWEAFERVMQKHGYFEGGLRKIEAARAVGSFVVPGRCSSRSFYTFWSAVEDAFS